MGRPIIRPIMPHLRMTFGLLIFGVLSIFFPALRTGWLHLGVPRSMGRTVWRSWRIGTAISWAKKQVRCFWSNENVIIFYNSCAEMQCRNGVVDVLRVCAIKILSTVLRLRRIWLLRSRSHELVEELRIWDRHADHRSEETLEIAVSCRVSEHHPIATGIRAYPMSWTSILEMICSSNPHIYSMGIPLWSHCFLGTTQCQSAS